MAGTIQTPQTPSAPHGGGSSMPGTALQAAKGTTKIADDVVAKVAGIAAREVGGVYGLGGTTTRAIGTVTQRVGVTESRSQGVSVEVSEHEATVQLTIVVDYGESIPGVAEEIRGQVITRVEGICGLKVTEVNITVNDLHFAGDDADSADRA